MKVRLGCLVALLALCACFAGGASSASAHGTDPCVEIFGAGSSLQKVAQEEVWIKGTEAFGATGEKWLNSICNTLPTIKYQSTSSGKAKAMWGNNSKKELLDETGVTFPAYLGSDVAPEGPATELGTQLENMDLAGLQGTGAGEGVVAVPVAQSAIAIIVSLPGNCITTAAANPKVWSKNLEKEWLSHALKGGELVEGGGVVAANCLGIPALYARGSASGTTAGFKRFLGHLLSGADEKEWESDVKTAGNSESNTLWPTLPTETVKGTLLEKGSQLVTAVFEPEGTTGAVGYADLADAVAHFTNTPVLHLVGTEKYWSFYVRVTNAVFTKNESPISPASGEGSNCAEAAYNEPAGGVTGNADWSQAYQTMANMESEKAKAYPICTLTFDLAWHQYKKAKEMQTEALHPYVEGTPHSVYAFIHYIVNEGQGAQLTAKHYGALPTAIKTKAVNGLLITPLEVGGPIQW